MQTKKSTLSIVSLRTLCRDINSFGIFDMCKHSICFTARYVASQRKKGIYIISKFCLQNYIEFVERQIYRVGFKPTYRKNKNLIFGFNSPNYEVLIYSDILKNTCSYGVCFCMSKISEKRTADLITKKTTIVAFLSSEIFRLGIPFVAVPVHIIVCSVSAMDIFNSTAYRDFAYNIGRIFYWFRTQIYGMRNVVNLHKIRIV